jgi:aryl-alcohol dehydrogenase-like predicted oxidoreductase
MSKQPEGAQVDGLKLPISRLVLGTMTFGDTVDEATAGRMVEEALDAGITTIDTANAYVGGTTEERLSRLLKGRRGDVSLASKAGMPHADHGSNSPLSPAGLRAHALIPRGCVCR